MDTHTHLHTHAHTHTHTHIHTHFNVKIHTDKHTHTHAHRYAHRYTDSGTVYNQALNPKQVGKIWKSGRDERAGGCLSEHACM